ncbi:hypothetical protein FRC12_018158 [Ceratobasidium sp. 428]|nr:hypothetical protein FRC12_018158 [Ceratobasidium sp. 428]
MGTTTPKPPKPDLSIMEILTCYAREDPEFDVILKHCSSLDLPNETCCRQYAKPGLPSGSSRSQHALSQSSSGQDCLIKHMHPEGRPYFQLGQFVTSDDMENPEIGKIMPQALALVVLILKQTNEACSDPVVQQELEFCIELESLTLPPEFNYYIVDRKGRSIFWASNHRPCEIENASEATRGNILREEYWKHVEYYPCHQFSTTEDYEELKQLLAAYATGKYKHRH